MKMLMMFSSARAAEGAGFRRDPEGGRWELKPWDTREVEAWWPSQGEHTFPGRRYDLVLVTDGLRRACFENRKDDEVLDRVLRHEIPACLLPHGRVVSL